MRTIMIPNPYRAASLTDAGLATDTDYELGYSHYGISTATIMDTEIE